MVELDAEGFAHVSEEAAIGLAECGWLICDPLPAATDPVEPPAPEYMVPKLPEPTKAIELPAEPITVEKPVVEEPKKTVVAAVVEKFTSKASKKNKK